MPAKRVNIHECRDQWLVMQTFVFGQHRMHEMQTIVTDDHGVCLSVTRLNSASLCKNGWMDQDHVWGEQSWGPWNIWLDRGSDLPQREGGGVGKHFAHCEPTTYFKNGWGRDSSTVQCVWCIRCSLCQITLASCLKTITINNYICIYS